MYKNLFKVGFKPAEVWTAEEIFTYDNIKRAIHDCLKGKRWKNSAVAGYINEHELIYSIMEMVRIDTPNFSKFYHFVINERGKEREISSLTFKDRVIQKVINQNFLLPVFTPKLVYDNYASLKGKGIDKALKRLKEFFRKAYLKYGPNFYILKLDMKSYFNTLKHERCMRLIKKYTDDKVLLDFFDAFFRVCKEDEVIAKGLQVDEGVGLGGEIPQTFGIIYLNEYDHIIKKSFKYSLRYMDDIIIIHKSRKKLVKFLECSHDYLESIGISININKTTIRTARQGIIFLKFTFKIDENGGVYLKYNKKGVFRERRKLRKLAKKFANGEVTFKDVLMHYMSWRGHAMRGNSHIVLLKMGRLFNELFIYPYVSKNLIRYAKLFIKNMKVYDKEYKKFIKLSHEPSYEDFTKDYFENYYLYLL